MSDTDVTYCTCGDEKLVCPDCLVDIIDKQERELAAARARIAILEGCINDMTEEQAAICAEGQSITELVAAKDKLIEQMRQALDATDEYYLDNSYAGRARNMPIVVKVREAQAALEVVERTNQ